LLCTEATASASNFDQLGANRLITTGTLDWHDDQARFSAEGQHRADSRRAAAVYRRICRDPPAAVVERKELTPHPTDREVRTVVIGVLLFALAIVIITLQFSDITSR